MTIPTWSLREKEGPSLIYSRTLALEAVSTLVFLLLKVTENSLPSSSSILLLPTALPKVFHGRAKEIDGVREALVGNSRSATAILGPGGISKSSLALSILHDDAITAKVGSRCYFIACDSSTSKR